MGAEEEQISPMAEDKAGTPETESLKTSEEENSSSSGATSPTNMEGDRRASSNSWVYRFWLTVVIFLSFWTASVTNNAFSIASIQGRITFRAYV